MKREIKVQRSARESNDVLARRNRDRFKESGLLVLNMISAPGSGKTSLLEAMARRMGRNLGVITGDVQTELDARRIRKAGARARQIETGGACHLTAGMVRDALDGLDLKGMEVLVIENIGNLVCPSSYDLGEDIKVAMLSVAEGDEKPVKYPDLFIRAGAVILSKVDLLPHVDFDLARAETDCRKLNSAVQIFRTSCRMDEGLDAWMVYLRELRSEKLGR